MPAKAYEYIAVVRFSGPAESTDNILEIMKTEHNNFIEYILS